MDDSIYWIAVMNQMFPLQLIIVVLTFNYAIVIISTSRLTSMPREFSLQTVTLYPQGGQLAGHKGTVRCQFMNYYYNL